MSNHLKNRSICSAIPGKLRFLRQLALPGASVAVEQKLEISLIRRVFPGHGAEKRTGFSQKATYNQTYTLSLHMLASVIDSKGNS